MSGITSITATTEKEIYLVLNLHPLQVATAVAEVKSGEISGITLTSGATVMFLANRADIWR